MQTDGRFAAAADRPAAGSVVYLRWPERDLKTVTDDRGRFTLHGCPPEGEIRCTAAGVRIEETRTKPAAAPPPAAPGPERILRVYPPGDEGRYLFWLDRGDEFEPELDDYIEVRTRLSGRVVLTFEHEDYGFGQIEVDVDGLEVDVHRDAFPVPGFIAVTDADGRPPGEVQIAIWHDGRWSFELTNNSGAWLLQPGAWILLQREDRATNHRTLTGSGVLALRLGGCTLDLGVSGADEPVAIVDGEPWEPTEENSRRFLVRGLDAGPHVVLVGARGHVGKAARVVLKAGESRKLSLNLAPR